MSLRIIFLWLLMVLSAEAQRDMRDPASIRQHELQLIEGRVLANYMGRWNGLTKESVAAWVSVNEAIGKPTEAKIFLSESKETPGSLQKDLDFYRAVADANQHDGLLRERLAAYENVRKQNLAIRLALERLAEQGRQPLTLTERLKLNSQIKALSNDQLNQMLLSMAEDNAHREMLDKEGKTSAEIREQNQMWRAAVNEVGGNIEEGK